jgi:GNAT superfamily N-acetyltransferase
MLNLRQANLDHIEALVQLRLALLHEVGNITAHTDTAGLTEAMRKYLAQKMPKGEFLAWVAEVDSQIVATTGLVFLQRPPVNGNLSGLEAYVMNIYTLPQWRGKGIATALLTEMISFVRGTEARRIWLHASKEGKRLYEKLGFISTTTEMELICSRKE